MKSSYGENLKLTIYGASHGDKIGMTLEGIPAGLAMDPEKLQAFLNRRAPGQNQWSTTRKEADIPHFLSGITDGYTNGETIEAVIYNENIKRSDYNDLKYIPRPGHADFTAWMKYGLDFDMSGGGPFSGRMTAPLCIAGGLCKQWLESKGIRIGAHILYISTGEHCDHYFDELNPEIDQIDQTFPVLNPDVGREMRYLISRLHTDGDSAGGLVECAVTGLPVGIGSHLFGGVESHLSQIIYAIPAVKEIRFGNDAVSIDMLGYEYNDNLCIKNGKITFDSNNAGGILGGITTGMPVIFQVGFKPTPSIARPQKSVNLKTMEEVTIEVKGRHDSCIVPRAVPVVEAVTALVLLDLLLEEHYGTF